MTRPKLKIKKPVSELEEALAMHLRALGLPFVREYRFARVHIGNPEKGIRAALAAHNLKDWRFDFALPERRLAVEVEGGIFNGGRHVRPMGFAADCEKYNAAVLLGWRVLRFNGEQVKNGDAANFIFKVVRASHD